MANNKQELYLLAGLAGVAGLGLVALSGRGHVSGGGGGGGTPTEVVGNPSALQAWTRDQGVVQLDSPSIITISTLEVQIAIAVLDPMALYRGPGRNTYAYAQLVQNQGGRIVSVAGSGVAGAFIGPAESSMPFHLVSELQPEPPGIPARSLGLYPWPGTNVGPISGAPPQPGPATLQILILQNASQSGNPADADGFSSPTYNPRQAFRQTNWTDRVMFV